MVTTETTTTMTSTPGAGSEHAQHRGQIERKGQYDERQERNVRDHVKKGQDAPDRGCETLQQ
jgi:hypothetical protein